MTFLSRHAQGIAYALFVIAAYIAAEQISGPSETDSLKAVADIDASLASMYAAANNQPAAQVAAKD